MRKSLFLLVLCASTSPLTAATYMQADFTGQLGSSANVKAPFSGAGGYFGGMEVTGSFVYQVEKVPGAGTGTTNVFFNSFDDAAIIPAADAFTIQFGAFTWTKADNLDGLRGAGIQYVNGAFNGFVFLTDFTFAGETYRFRTEGGTFNVRKVVGGVVQTTNFISGTFNAPYINATPYTPGAAPAVPEPASWALMIGGLGLMGAAMRRRKMTVAFG